MCSNILYSIQHVTVMKSWKGVTYILNPLLLSEAMPNPTFFRRAGSIAPHVLLPNLYTITSHYALRSFCMDLWCTMSHHRL